MGCTKEKLEIIEKQTVEDWDNYAGIGVHRPPEIEIYNDNGGMGGVDVGKSQNIFCSNYSETGTRFQQFYLM